VKRVRAPLLLALTSALILVFPLMASAAKPERLPPPSELFDTTFDAGTICPFELHYQELVNNETTTVLSDTQRRVTGAYKARLTNTATGATLDVNASGPQFFTDIGDIETAVLPGPQLFLLGGTDVNGPGAFLIRGRTTTTRDLAEGSITAMHVTGRTTDLCAALS
jgi:hypothetical protein